MDYLKKFDKIVDEECLKHKYYKQKKLKRLETGFVTKDIYGNIITKTPINARQFSAILDKYGVFEQMKDPKAFNVLASSLFSTLRNQFSQEEVDDMIAHVNIIGFTEDRIRDAILAASGQPSTATNFSELILDLLQYFTAPAQYQLAPDVQEDVGVVEQIEDIIQSAQPFTPSLFPTGYIPELPTQREMAVGEAERAQMEAQAGRPTQLTLTGQRGRPAETLIGGGTFSLELPPSRFAFPTVQRQFSPSSLSLF